PGHQVEPAAAAPARRPGAAPSPLPGQLGLPRRPGAPPVEPGVPGADRRPLRPAAGRAGGGRPGGGGGGGPGGPPGPGAAGGAGVGGGLVWTAGGAVVVWPHGLCYTNELWGGTANGYRRLSDSNYDWGQGLPELAAWQRRSGVTALDVWYFGTDPALGRLPL